MLNEQDLVTIELFNAKGAIQYQLNFLMLNVTIELFFYGVTY